MIVKDVLIYISVENFDERLLIFLNVFYDFIKALHRILFAVKHLFSASSLVPQEAFGDS